MAEPTISEVFGASSNGGTEGLNISQTIGDEFGVPDTGVLTAEGWLVTILLKARQVLTEENRNLDVNNRQVTIVDSGQDLFNQNGVNYRRQAFTVLLYKPEPLDAINPTDY